MPVYEPANLAAGTVPEVSSVALRAVSDAPAPAIVVAEKAVAVVVARVVVPVTARVLEKEADAPESSPEIVGVVKVGLVPNTATPVPVSLVKAVLRLAEVKEPSEAALPTEVTIPVRLALVVTLPAVRPDAVPVMLVPKIGRAHV